MGDAGPDRSTTATEMTVPISMDEDDDTSLWDMLGLRPDTAMTEVPDSMWDSMIAVAVDPDTPAADASLIPTDDTTPDVDDSPGVDELAIDDGHDDPVNSHDDGGSGLLHDAHDHGLGHHTDDLSHTLDTDPSVEHFQHDADGYDSSAEVEHPEW